MGKNEVMSVSRLWQWFEKPRQAVGRRWPGRRDDADRHVPSMVYPDDVYLVSYPRSGNTWARFMLANLIRPAGAEVTFQNIMRFVPAVHQDLSLLDTIPRPRFVKSHAPLEPRYPRSIYLVRDGRDVYVSYYHYQRQKLPPGTTLADYLVMEHWPCSWGEHVNSWLDAALPQDRFLLIRYERLYEQPEQELRRMAVFAGLDATDAEISRAVQNSTFDSMRQIEETEGHPRAGRFSGKFVRSGRVGGWQAHFGAHDREIFKALGTENEALVRLGYESSADW